MGLSQRALAEAISRSQGYIGDIEAGRSAPSREMLDRLSNVFGLNSDWLLTGRGEPVVRDTVQTQQQVAQVQRYLPTPDTLRYARRIEAEREPEYVQDVSLIRLALFDIDDTGTGLVPSYDPDAIVALAQGWFDERGIDPAQCGLMRAPDDHMRPTIPFGARVVVEFATVLTPLPPVWVIVLDGRICLRRIGVRDLAPDGAPSAVTLYTDAHTRPDLPLDGDDLGRIEIKGRVRAVLTELD